MLELINSVSQCEGGSSLLKASVQQGSDITPAGCGCSVAKLCLTLRNPMGCSLPGSSVHGIFQARVLGWSGVPLPSLLCILGLSK